MPLYIHECILQRSFLILIFLSAGKLFSQPIADFSGIPVTGCAPLLVKFNDLSTGNPANWQWDLGNGTISFIQNPSGTYFSSGKYRITLIVSNDAGADTLVRDQYITVLSAPEVNFTSDRTSGCLPLPVKFIDQSSAGNGVLNTWKWDFGDGYIDSIQNPQHTYTLPGTHDITLQVTNSFGCSGSVSKTKFVDIPPKIKADFSNTLQNSCKPPVIVTFKNLSIGPASLTYQWNFGDGSNSVLENPSHQYTSAGNYTVQLITSSVGECADTVERIITGRVKADFINPVTLCRGKAFVFTNISNPTPISVLWNFGDGTISRLFEPAKTYNIPGDYSVKMIADFGDCRDSISQTVTVLPIQNISIIPDDSASCTVPFTVNFTSNVQGVSTYNWNFGDGTTSTEANPSHTYLRLGNFDVTLIAGCGDVIKMPKLIKIKKTTVTLPDLPLQNCIPFTHTFIPKITSLDSIVSYNWDFGDGSSAISATPTHTFTAIGTYPISLNITTNSGCTIAIKKAEGVSVGNKPTANFSAGRRLVCAKEYIQFNDLSTGDVTKWLWDFGDGDTSTTQNPLHHYKDTGYFTVTLISRSNGCPSEISFTNYIYVRAPVAKFIVKNDCSNPKQKSFADASIAADSWKWNFGDGATSDSANPFHTYADTGSYLVTLRVKNIATGCDYSTSKMVRVIILKAEFATSDTDICKGSTPIFQIQNSNVEQTVSYNWSFGDGPAVNFKSDSAPAGLKFPHRYTRIGNYTVRLIVRDSVGCRDTLLKPFYMNVSVPTAAFISNNQGTCLNTRTDFIDSSFSNGSHKITRWIWNYGDSTIESLTGPPFQHTYKKPGTYSVKLKIIEDNGCSDSLRRPDYIVISKPVAEFITEDTVSCPSGLVRFKNLSSGPKFRSAWSFGDGATSDSANPVHTYSAPGTFTVSLVITDDYGCSDSIKKAGYITINNPVADFYMSDSTSTCPPFFVSFNNVSAYDSTLLWDFGDGNISALRDPIHSYFLPGTYTVKLRITGRGGCIIEKNKKIVIKGPNGTFSYTNTKGCNPLQSNFKASTTNNISFIWDFNDGNIVTTTDSIVSHKFTNTGTYLPKMILIDENGCQVPIIGIDSITVFEVNANFIKSANQICDSGFISFKDSSISNDLIKSYLWNFGDGTTSDKKDPVHFFNNTGSYITKLLVTTLAGCKDSTDISLPLKVIGSPEIDISGSGGACIPATFNLSGRVLTADTSALIWKWDMGNGNVSTQQNPSPQVYPVPGNFIVQSIATNSSGCSDTTVKAVQAYASPQVVANIDSWLCRGSAINLSAAGAEDYSWSPSTGLSCINCASPVARPQNAIQYIVRGTSINGCLGSDTVLISVQSPFDITVSESSSLCSGSATLLRAAGSDNYIWSPATGLDDATIATPLATPAVTTNYRVIGSDEHNCFTDTGYVAIQISPVPTVKAGIDETINVGQTIDLVPQISADVTNVNWSPTSGVFRNNYPGISVRPVASTEYTVEVNNVAGCMARDQLTVYVICNDANIFMPNTFSPNGDGANDVFYPRGSGVFTVKMFKIFNRWGEVVFEKGNINSNIASVGWDGTFKGKKLPPDVFVYMLNVICDNNSILVFKGNVALIR